MVDRIDPKLLKPGDVIVVNCSFAESGFLQYQHWSLVSDNKCKKGYYKLISASSRTDTVKEEPFHDVVKSGEHIEKINIESCLTTEELLAKAKRYIDVWEYNLYSNNCEHFVKFIISGSKESRQVDNVKSYAKVGAVVAGGGGAIFSVFNSLTSEEPYDLGDFFRDVELTIGLSVFGGIIGASVGLSTSREQGTPIDLDKLTFSEEPLSQYDLEYNDLEYRYRANQEDEMDDLDFNLLIY